jgi:hypothetical protein
MARNLSNTPALPLADMTLRTKAFTGNLQSIPSMDGEDVGTLLTPASGLPPAMPHDAEMSAECCPCQTAKT